MATPTSMLWWWWWWWCRMTSGWWPRCTSGSSYVTEWAADTPVASRWCGGPRVGVLQGRKFWTFRLCLLKERKRNEIILIASLKYNTHMYNARLNAAALRMSAPPPQWNGKSRPGTTDGRTRQLINAVGTSRAESSSLKLGSNLSTAFVSRFAREQRR